MGNEKVACARNTCFKKKLLKSKTVWGSWRKDQIIGFKIFKKIWESCNEFAETKDEIFFTFSTHPPFLLHISASHQSTLASTSVIPRGLDRIRFYFLNHFHQYNNRWCWRPLRTNAARHNLVILWHRSFYTVTITKVFFLFLCPSQSPTCLHLFYLYMFHGQKFSNQFLVLNPRRVLLIFLITVAVTFR